MAAADHRADRPDRRDPPTLSRRSFCKALAATSLAGGAAPAIAASRSGMRNVIVLGIDGMDPNLLTQYMRDGLMPNCRKLGAKGTFRVLGTSDPPQSPVAWSSFISGTNPGGHGIFDFIARDASTIKPYLSTARTEPSKLNLRLGKYSLPLSGARVELLRGGHTLWKLLEDAGISSTVMRAPVNFPPTETRARTISGLGTPDIHGSYGVFTLYTESFSRRAGDLPGGQIDRVVVAGNKARGVLHGPVNSLRLDQSPVDVEFQIELNSERSLVLVRLPDRNLLLRSGEWSDWVTVKFPMIKHVASTTGVCRFYLKSTKPSLELYVSPINIDPDDPSMPISTPDRYARRLVRDVGLFHTQGMPEDTAALSAGVFDDAEYRAQATFVLEEQLRLAEHELNRFRDGFLFLYFSSLDLNSHAFWRCIDEKHPMYSPEVARQHGDFIPWLYRQMDAMVGRAMELADDRTVLFALSDHGFVSFRRQFNLNAWLMDNGYATPLNALDRGESGFFMNTDWRETMAYGLGINSLYLNLRGREPDGTVRPGEDAKALRNELIQKLTALRDPQNGEPVITHVYRPEDVYSGPFVSRAPDLVVGYNRNYRASWDTILGKYPRDVLADNNDPWSGDHCMDARFLPGVCLSNHDMQRQSPTLEDMAPTILNAFGVPIPEEMTGQDMGIL